MLSKIHKSMPERLVSRPLKHKISRLCFVHDVKLDQAGKAPLSYACESSPEHLRMASSVAQVHGYVRMDKHPKAPGTAGRIPSLRGGTAKNSCSSGARRGPRQRTAVWSWPVTTAALTTAAMLSVDWRNGPRFTRAWQPRRWSGAVSSLTVAN